MSKKTRDESLEDKHIAHDVTYTMRPRGHGIELMHDGATGAKLHRKTSHPLKHGNSSTCTNLASAWHGACIMGWHHE